MPSDEEVKEDEPELEAAMAATTTCWSSSTGAGFPGPQPSPDRPAASAFPVSLASSGGCRRLFSFRGAEATLGGDAGTTSRSLDVLSPEEGGRDGLSQRAAASLLLSLTEPGGEGRTGGGGDEKATGKRGQPRNWPLKTLKQ